MKDKYTFGWHDPRGVHGDAIPRMPYGESIKNEEKDNKPNVPLWFKLIVKFIYWIQKMIKNAKFH